MTASSDLVASLVTERLAAVPGVSAVYAKRGVAGAARAAAAAIARSAPAEPRASVRISGSAATVEATIGVAGDRPAREIAEEAYAATRAAILELRLTAQAVTIRVATID